ncbi:MAG: 50S ribosomal protein L10 [Pseudomonadota bacterium]
MPTNAKKETVKTMQSEFADSSAMIVMHYHGLTVNDITNLRLSMRSSNVKFRVIKNKLAKIAVKNTEFAEAEVYFNGPTAIAYADEPVAAAKCVANFAKNNESLKIIGGVHNGDMLTEEDVQTLAKLPPLEVLRAKIIGVLQTPATRIAGILKEPASQLARVVNAYAEKQ